MFIPIFDLHCDLLSYLQIDSNRSFLDPISCGYPRLLQGGVKWQLLPIFTETSKGSTQIGQIQWQHYQKLIASPYFSSNFHDSKTITVQLAIENASSFFEENEDFELGIKRLEDVLINSGAVAYVSLTWNGANRFGGGCGHDKKLTEDGKKLVDYLVSKNIAIDVSHSSDDLLFSLLDYLDFKGYDCKLIASHSNVRDLKNEKRNLPYEGIQEIIRRKGVIGLNLIKHFIGDQSSDQIFDHVDYLLNMKGENSLCIGADFFHAIDHPRPGRTQLYYEEFSHSGCYQKLFMKMKTHLSLPQELIEKIAYKNALKFFC